MNLTRIFSGGDPFLMRHNGKYYIYCTTENSEKLQSPNAFNTEKDGRDGFYVYQSADMTHWENKGLCLSKENVIGDKWFWAPEVSYYKGKFYMVYSANEHPAIAVSDSPTGPFEKHSDGWLCEEPAIDGHLLFDESGIYLYYVKLEKGNRIFVAKMSDDLKRIEHEYENVLIQAEEKWETIDSLVAEGPFVIKHNGLYYLSYSCNHTRSEDYAVGYAVADNPIGPFKKYKYNPILKKKGNVVGVGHNSYMPSDDENSFICAYHCHNDNCDNFKPRMVCLCEAKFEKDSNTDIDVLKMYY